jgi:hypothetical protein
MTDIPADFVYVLLEQRVPISRAPFPQFADAGVYERINVVVVPLYILYVSLFLYALYLLYSKDSYSVCVHSSY